MMFERYLKSSVGQWATLMLSVAALCGCGDTEKATTPQPVDAGAADARDDDVAQRRPDVVDDIAVDVDEDSGATLLREAVVS